MKLGTHEFEAEGPPELFSFNVMRQVCHPGFAAEVPYAVVIIKLAEGAKMVPNLVGVPPDAILIGMPVRAVFEDITDEVTLPKFRAGVTAANSAQSGSGYSSAATPVSTLRCASGPGVVLFALP